MNKQQIAIIAVSFLLGVLVGYFFFLSQMKENPICPQATQKDCPTTSNPSITSTPMSEWETFVNTKYGYEVKIPPKTFVYADVGNPPDIHQEAHLSFRAEKEYQGGYLDVDMKIIFPGMERDMKKESFTELKKLLALDLKSYAETIRNTKLEYVNRDSNKEKGQKVGEMKEIQIDGQKAYEFVADTLFYGLHTPQQINFTLDVTPLRYIIVENLSGQKIIIQQTLNNISEKMVQSIKFIK